MQLLQLKQKYHTHSNLIYWYLSYFLFYITAGILILALVGFDNGNNCADCMSKKEASLFLFKIFSGFTLFAISVLGLIYLIGKLFSFLFTAILPFLAFLKFFTPKKSFSPIQSIIGLLITSHLAYLIICAAIIFKN